MEEEKYYFYIIESVDNHFYVCRDCSLQLDVDFCIFISPSDDPVLYVKYEEIKCIHVYKTEEELSEAYVGLKNDISYKSVVPGTYTIW